MRFVGLSLQGYSFNRLFFVMSQCELRTVSVDAVQCTSCFSKVSCAPVIKVRLTNEEVTNQQRCFILTHCGLVTQFCVFNTVKHGTSASSP